MNTKHLIIALATVLICSCDPKEDKVSVAYNELARFYQSTTVDWLRIDTIYYRPYDSDWPDEVGKLINPDFPAELIPLYWHLTQNAKKYLHQQTLPLRIGASDEFIQQLNRTESALDTFFIRMVSQPYYRQVDIDCYQEIIPQEVTKCFELYDRPK